MDFLSRIPTDSLYKMLAIGGVLLTAGCYYASQSFQYFIASKIADLSTEQIDSRGETEDLLIRLGTDAKIIQGAIDSATADHSNPALLPAGDQRNEIIEKLNAGYGNLLSLAQDKTLDEDAKKLVSKARRSTRAMEAHLSQVWNLVDLGDRIRKWSTAGSVAGIVLALIGFPLWYFKIQRYQDQVLIKQAADAGH